MDIKMKLFFICSFDLKRKLNPGEELTFQGKASWLACFTTCLPTYDNLEITILVEKEPEIDDRWSPYFQDFRNEQPIIRQRIGYRNAMRKSAKKKRRKGIRNL